MISSALWHAFFAVLIQMALSPLFGFLSAGWIACAVFFGREIAQHEYKGGGPKVVKWYYGWVKHWNLDSVLDVLFPAIATGAVWLISIKF